MIKSRNIQTEEENNTDCLFGGECYRELHLLGSTETMTGNDNRFIATRQLFSILIRT